MQDYTSVCYQAHLSSVVHLQYHMHSLEKEKVSETHNLAK